MIRISLILSVLLLAPLSGCLDSSQSALDSVESPDDCVVYSRDDDNILKILTYDSLAISDEVLNEFTNQSLSLIHI